MLLAGPCSVGFPGDRRRRRGGAPRPARAGPFGCSGGLLRDRFHGVIGSLRRRRQQHPARRLAKHVLGDAADLGGTRSAHAPEHRPTSPGSSAASANRPAVLTMSSSSLVPNTGTRIVSYSASSTILCRARSGTSTRCVGETPSTKRR